MNANFKVIGLTRLGIKPMSTAAEANALTTQPSELIFLHHNQMFDVLIEPRDCAALCMTFGLQNTTDRIAEWYRASASGSVDLGFDSESGQTNDLKIRIHSFPA